MLVENKSRRYWSRKMFLTNTRKMKGKRTSPRTAAVAVLFLIIASIQDEVNGISVDVTPRNPVLKEGESFTFKCTVGKPLLYCRIKLPNDAIGLNLNEETEKSSEYWYEGEGLNSGQCGITIPRIRDIHNGRFDCTMGFRKESIEAVGSTNVTVAKPPQGQPELQVSPRPDPNLRGAYREDIALNARCIMRDARPVATLSWYIGDEPIRYGISKAEILESPGNLYTVSQNLSYRLSWKDSGKDLRCVATHVTLNNSVRQTIQQINVVFPPRPKKDRRIEKFGLVIGEESVVAVPIQANPKPYMTWIIGGESVPEGKQDSTRRFSVSSTQPLGNSTWETTLTISAIVPEDVDRKYLLKSRNELGDQEYNVIISTSPKPEGAMMELGTGPIIGIVVAILVLLFIIFMLIFARATGRWCFSGGAPSRHDNKESSDTESADHGPAVKNKKPKMNLTYILKKKKDKVAADAEDLKLQTVAMEPEKESEKPGTESSEHIATPAKGKGQGQDVVYAELDLQATRRPVVRREDEKTEYAEIIHTNPGKGGGESA